jgi:elongin-A
LEHSIVQLSDFASQYLILYAFGIDTPVIDFTITMPVASLFELARQRLIKNIDMLRDVGDLPYSFLQPVLRFVQSPDQLLELETNCPQLLGETGEIWLRFIKRDIPDWEKKPHEPRDPRNWSKVYRKLKKDAELEKEADKEALKQQMQALQKDRAQNKTLIVETRFGYGAGASKMFTGRTTSSWGQPSGAPAKTGKAAFDKLKRGMFDHGRERPKASHISQHLLAQRKTIVRQAPARMVRMAENEAPRSMVVSKQASASVTNKPESQPTPSLSANRPNITQRPAPQQRNAPPARTSLPLGMSFSAPKPRAPNGQSAAEPALKRKRPEYNMFHTKKKKV